MKHSCKCHVIENFWLKKGGFLLVFECFHLLVLWGTSNDYALAHRCPTLEPHELLSVSSHQRMPKQSHSIKLKVVATSSLEVGRSTWSHTFLQMLRNTWLSCIKLNLTWPSISPLRIRSMNCCIKTRQSWFFIELNFFSIMCFPRTPQ